MTSEAFFAARHLCNGNRVLEHTVFRDALLGEESDGITVIQAAMRHGVYHHRVSRTYGQDGRDRGRDDATMDGFRRGFETQGLCAKRRPPGCGKAGGKKK